MLCHSPCRCLLILRAHTRPRLRKQKSLHARFCFRFPLFAELVCRENDKRQEFMILPVGAKSFKEALCIGCEVGFFSDLAKGC